jgi:hypothetical protein
LSTAPPDLPVVDEGGAKFVEGSPDEHLLSGVADVDRVIEACFSERVLHVVLYPRNLPDTFFDLSSGVAGAILQKLRQYGIRSAVVCAPGEVRFSTRFKDMVAEERRGSHFGVFETREEALAWLSDARP